MSVRINAASGDKFWPGFVNVDAYNNMASVQADIRKMPFDPNYADEIHAIHCVEHIPRLEVDNMLMDWHRILKSGGKLVIEVPCLNKIAKMILDGEKNLTMTVMGIFGDPRDAKRGMMHGWAYTREELMGILDQAGYVAIEEKQPVFHVKRRDMRIEARKP